jgi:hypothetical protein
MGTALDPDLDWQGQSQGAGRLPGAMGGQPLARYVCRTRRLWARPAYPRRLLLGSTDTESDRFNNLAGWTAHGAVLEVRVPWMALGFADPSKARNFIMTGQGKGLAVGEGPSTAINLQVLLLNGQGRTPCTHAHVPFWTHGLTEAARCVLGVLSRGQSGVGHPALVRTDRLDNLVLL